MSAFAAFGLAALYAAAVEALAASADAAGVVDALAADLAASALDAPADPVLWEYEEPIDGFLAEMAEADLLHTD